MAVRAITGFQVWSCMAGPCTLARSTLYRIRDRIYKDGSRSLSVNVADSMADACAPFFETHAAVGPGQASRLLAAFAPFRRRFGWWANRELPIKTSVAPAAVPVASLMQPWAGALANG